MADILHHRGPDEGGFFHDDKVSLGHRRLSIIDLARGHQPMFSADRNQVIVYNGEIYNFKEIRSELISRGHVFKTQSDTEVILNAYRQWGFDCLEKFNGMFAFALWDNTLKKLWLVRDRLGKKPLYIMSLGSSFYFASETKALSGLPFFEEDYDARAIDQYLTYRYVPSTRTFYKKIKKVPAGSWVLVSDEGQILQAKEWWQIPQTRESPKDVKRKTLRSYQEEFQSLFSSAVKLRLISDVPLGLFLSSGIDSASIAIEMAKVSTPTFVTVGFGGEIDEVHAAAELSRELKGRHRVFEMTHQDFDYLPEVVAAMDEPYGDAIILPTFLLARRASECVKVILTGDGADEILGSYVHQTFFRKMPDHLPGFIRRTMALVLGMVPSKALSAFFHYPAELGSAGKGRLKELLKTYSDGRSAYLNWASLFPEKARQELYTSDFKDMLSKEPDEFEEDMQRHFAQKNLNLFDKVLRWDLKTWFPEQTLMKLDRLGMANSIEGRCPYADYRLVEFFLKLPFHFYKSLCDNKHVVRRIYQPKNVSLPRQKKPFFLPMNKTFDAKLRQFQNEVLQSHEINRLGWFEPQMVERLHQDRRRSPLLVDKQIMSLTVLLYWLREKKKQGQIK